MEKNKQLEEIIHANKLCSCGRKHGTSLKNVIIEKNALEKLPDVILSLGSFPDVVMICDENTYKAAGRRAEEICSFSKTVCLSPEGLHATEKAVETAESQIEKCDLLVAIGSGTIHDITRFIAHKRGIDFVSVPTAASVDGFVSGVAAMTWHGVK
ncbi:MAG: iron-containing alcohol dehydrogenase, partial [Eubacteriales bacterium]